MFLVFFVVQKQDLYLLKENNFREKGKYSKIQIQFCREESREILSGTIISQENKKDSEVACSHELSINVLRSRCSTSKKEDKLFLHCTGFQSYLHFKYFLDFVAPTRMNIHSFILVVYLTNKLLQDLDFLTF